MQIVATESTDGGCSYLAQGNSGDMTAKHMAAMLGAKGADAKTQQMIQGLAGGFVKMFQSEGHDTDLGQQRECSGVRLQRGQSRSRSPNAAQRRRCSEGWDPVSRAFRASAIRPLDEAGAMMMVRKGDKLIRIMYSTCPCSVDAIKPLAKMLADRL